MVLPLLFLAAGIVAQQAAKDQSIKAQKKVLVKHSEDQLKAQNDVSQQLHTEMDAHSADQRNASEQAATDRLRTTSENSDTEALNLFDGSNGGTAGDRATSDAVRAQAGKRGAAYAGINGNRISSNERRRLGLDVGANIAGIRQRARRSLSLLPSQLETASHKGDDLNTIGGLAASYGYGGTSDWLSSLAKEKAQTADNADYYGQRRPTMPQSPGATDLWGEEDPYHRQS